MVTYVSSKLFKIFQIFEVPKKTRINLGPAAGTSFTLLELQYNSYAGFVFD